MKLYSVMGEVFEASAVNHGHLIILTSSKSGICRIWGFLGDDYKDCCLLGCGAV